MKFLSCRHDTKQLSALLVHDGAAELLITTKYSSSTVSYIELDQCKRETFMLEQRDIHSQARL